MKALCVALTVLVLASGAARAEPSGTINIQVENDSFIGGIDRHYTSGLYGSWTSAPGPKDAIMDFAENLMLPGDGEWRYGFFGGQTMFTPDNTIARIPPADDQPYAGFLFGGARLYRDDGDTLDKIEATFGVIGPASLAANVQNWWHAMGLFGGVQSRGWHYQLHNEPGLILSEQRIWRIKLSDGWLESEILPQVNGSVGNKTLVGDFNAGAALLFPDFRLLGSYTARSKEFPGQHGTDQTVAVTLSFAD